MFSCYQKNLKSCHMWFPMFSDVFMFGNDIFSKSSVHAWSPSRWKLPRSPPVCRMKCDRRNARLWNVGERRVVKVRRQVTKHWLGNAASEIFWRQHHQRKRQMKVKENGQNGQRKLQMVLMLTLLLKPNVSNVKSLPKLKARRRRRQRQRHLHAKAKNPHQRHNKLMINMFISSKNGLEKGRPGIIRFERTRSMVAAHAGLSSTDVKHANGQGSRAGLRRMSVQKWRLLRRFKIRVPQLLLRKGWEGNVSLQGMWIERFNLSGLMCGQES